MHDYTTIGGLMVHPDWHKVLDTTTETIAVCSMLHTVLPPWDWRPDFVTQGLAEFPLAQKMFFGVFNNRWYRVAIYTIGFIALNGRSTIWKFISVKNPESPNASVATIVHAANNINGRSQ
jgi:hypothetical protein